jgi:hypothetical protein
MFFSKTSEVANFNLYLKMLNLLVYDNKREYRQIFTEVITYSKKVSSDRKNYYNIKPEIFDLVKLLTASQSNKLFFSSINEDDISDNTFKDLLNILRSSIQSKSSEVSI